MLTQKNPDPRGGFLVNKEEGWENFHDGRLFLFSFFSDVTTTFPSARSVSFPADYSSVYISTVKQKEIKII